MAEQGVEVHAFDMRSFGQSETDPGKRGIIDKFSDVIDDLEDFFKQTQQSATAGLPIFLAGSSLGGLIAATTALRVQPALAGLLLFSPSMDVQWTPMLRFQAKIGAFIAWAAPRARIVPAVRVEDMSEDAGVREHYVNDGLNFIGPVRARTGHEILGGMRAIMARAAEFTLPIYGQHGATDRCTSLDGHKKFLASVSSKDTTLNVVDGGYHELLQGPQKEACTATITDWILSHAASPPQQVAKI